MDQTADDPDPGRRPAGRVLGLDLGDARVGVAISDPERRVAVPHGTIRTGQPPGELKAVAALVGELDVTAVVVGHPRSMSGASGPRAQQAEAFAEALRAIVGVPVELQDERLSTAEAESAAAEAAVKVADDNIRTAEATVARSRADLEKARINFNRTKQLFDAKLVASQEYDQRRIDVTADEAALNESELRVTQLRAQKQQTAANLSSMQRRIAVSQANLRRAQDVLQRTMSVAPSAMVVPRLVMGATPPYTPGTTFLPIISATEWLP